MAEATKSAYGEGAPVQASTDPEVLLVARAFDGSHGSVIAGAGDRFTYPIPSLSDSALPRPGLFQKFLCICACRLRRVS